jgi:hypothetical protein
MMAAQDMSTETMLRADDGVRQPCFRKGAGKTMVLEQRPDSLIGDLCLNTLGVSQSVSGRKTARSCCLANSRQKMAVKRQSGLLGLTQKSLRFIMRSVKNEPKRLTEKLFAVGRLGFLLLLTIS